MDSRKILFALLQMQVCGADVGEEIKKALSPQMLKEVYSLALNHDMAHIAGQALSKLGMLGDDEASQKLKKQAMLAVYRHARMEQEYKNICMALEEAEIPYLPLKGAVLRDYYPQAWMRTSCDIDILVSEESLEQALKAVQETLHYRYQEKTSHDISLFSPSNVHLELHYDLMSDATAAAPRSVLVNVWSSSIPAAGEMYRHEMPDEMFYFYHIAHMAKHFGIGGCGIKPFLDLWILNHKVELDRKNREQLLAEGELQTFANAAQKLSEVWFSGAEADEMSCRLEQYILEGGVYGTLKNSVAVKQAQKGGKLQYVLYKIWLPYNVIKYYYPVLQKHKWLTPVCQLRRWLRLLFGGGLKHAVHTIKTNVEIDEKEQASMQLMLDELGL